MTAIRVTLGFLSLTALAVGMVCGVLGLGSDTVAWWWLTGAVTGGVWGFLKWAQTGERERDPVTLPPLTIQQIQHMRNEGWQRRWDGNTSHMQWDGKRAVWPAESGGIE